MLSVDVNVNAQKRVKGHGGREDPWFSRENQCSRAFLDVYLAL